MGSETISNLRPYLSKRDWEVLASTSIIMDALNPGRSLEGPWYAVVEGNDEGGGWSRCSHGSPVAGNQKAAVADPVIMQPETPEEQLPLTPQT